VPTAFVIAVVVVVAAAAAAYLYYYCCYCPLVAAAAAAAAVPSMIAVGTSFRDRTSFDGCYSSIDSIAVDGAGTAVC